MKFSIIIPVYNAEKFLRQSIQSVLNQSNQDFEIVLVNDGSTDGSQMICDEYVDKYPEKIRVLHQKNQGQLLTRNNGVQFAQGEYCLFLDADDLLIADALEELENAIIRYDNPEMIIYSFYYDRFLGQKESAALLFPEEVYLKKEEKKLLYEKFFSTTLLNNVWTKAVKRSVFKKEFPNYNEYATLRCSEDRFHSMGMVTNSDSIVYIPKQLYEYKIIPNSISRTFTVDAIDRFNVKILYEDELSYMKRWGLDLQDSQGKLDAGWIQQTWYVFNMFYQNATNREQRKKILHYPWIEFVPNELLSNYKTNPYLLEGQKECWKWIVEKKYNKLEFFFLKKAVTKKLREVKRKFVGKNSI